MPVFVRFTLVAAILAALGYIGLYVMAVHFEPEQKEVRKSVPSIQIKRE
ncbi:MAG: hypothetical protein ACFCUN_11760 [Hyphomicrobiaceae bacterium]